MRLRTAARLKLTPMPPGPLPRMRGSVGEGENCGEESAQADFALFQPRFQPPGLNGRVRRDRRGCRDRLRAVREGGLRAVVAASLLAGARRRARSAANESAKADSCGSSGEFIRSWKGGRTSPPARLTPRCRRHAAAPRRHTTTTTPPIRHQHRDAPERAVSHARRTERHYMLRVRVRVAWRGDSGARPERRRARRTWKGDPRARVGRTSRKPTVDAPPNRAHQHCV